MHKFFGNKSSEFWFNFHQETRKQSYLRLRESVLERIAAIQVKDPKITTSILLEIGLESMEEFLASN